jgi:hypothetical protein
MSEKRSEKSWDEIFAELDVAGPFPEDFLSEADRDMRSPQVRPEIEGLFDDDNNGGRQNVQIPAEEIVNLLRRVIKGQAKMQAVGESWIDGYGGNVNFLIDGYTVVLFNDCSELDYVDHAVAPDGRQTTFSEWFDSGSGEPISLMYMDEVLDLKNLASVAEVIDAAGDSTCPD